MGQDRECDYGMPLHDHQADDSRVRKYNKGIFHVFQKDRHFLAWTEHRFRDRDELV